MKKKKKQSNQQIDEEIIDSLYSLVDKLEKKFKVNIRFNIDSIDARNKSKTKK